MCLTPAVRTAFSSARPAAGQRYRPAQLKPYSFGTNGAQSVALASSAAAFGVNMTIEGAGLKWTGLQVPLHPPPAQSNLCPVGLPSPGRSDSAPPPPPPRCR